MIRVLGLLLLLAAPLAAKGETMTPSSPETAAHAVAEQYARTFGNLYVKSPLDSSYLAFPALSPQDFRLVEETPELWVFVHEPLSGPTIRARVARANGFVVFDQVTVSTE